MIDEILDLTNEEALKTISQLTTLEERSNRMIHLTDKNY